jgi:hypothetical protein
VSTVPDALRALVDDGAALPPHNAPLSQALSEHRRQLHSAHGAVLGTFVVADEMLPALLELAEPPEALAPEATPLRLGVAVTGGAGALEPAVRWAGRSAAFELAAVTIGLRDESDLARNARRTTLAVDQLRVAGDLDEAAVVYVEPPPSGPRPPASWFTALDEVAAADLALAFRVAGPAVPSPAELATCIDAALDRELPFTVVGVPDAVRPDNRPDDSPDDSGATTGVLNLLAATRAALDGSSAQDLAAVVAESDPDRLRELLDSAGPAALASARRWFRSVRAGDVRASLAQLDTLGLLTGQGR